MGKAQGDAPGLKALRDAIPKHCFQSSAVVSLGYILSDLAAMCGLFMLGTEIISVSNTPLRWLLWTIYGFAQGCIFTGIWILAHECGHAALFRGRFVNDCFGFPLHTLLMVPYFSWKYSHARHHRYANNMSKDTVFVPRRQRDFNLTDWLVEKLDLAEDAPLLNLVVLLGHQILGWPMYIFLNVTAGEESLQHSKHSSSMKQSHLDPTGDVFRLEEHPFILLSDFGLIAMVFALMKAAESLGYANVALLYGLPYLWVNNWIVAITFLHHTHPEAEHYEADSWTFEKGALMTIDRDFGFVGKELFHGIIEFHVVHHLFARIPFYHAEEATQHIKELLGDRYMHQETSFLADMYNTFTQCKYVEQSPNEAGALTWAKS